MMNPSHIFSLSASILRIVATNFTEKTPHYICAALMKRLSLKGDEFTNALRQRDDAIESTGSAVPNLPFILVGPERLTKRIVDPVNHVHSSKVGKS